MLENLERGTGLKLRIINLHMSKLLDTYRQICISKKFSDSKGLIIIMYLCFRSCTQWSILGFFSSYYFWLCSRGAPKHISGIASLIIVVIFQLIRPYLASSKRKDQQTLIRKSDCCSCVATASGNKTYYPMLQTIRKINRRALLRLKSCKVAHLLKLSC